MFDKQWKGQHFTCINFLSEKRKLIFMTDNEHWNRSAMARHTRQGYSPYEEWLNLRALPGAYLRWHYHWDLPEVTLSLWLLLLKSPSGLFNSYVTWTAEEGKYNSKHKSKYLPSALFLEGRNRDGKLRDGKFSSRKIIVISVIGIQSTAVQRGSLPPSYLHSFRNGTRRCWHHRPQVWTIPLLSPFGLLCLGQKGYRAALPRAVPALLCMECPPRDTWGPAMYRTSATNWPRDPWVHCARTLYLLLHLPSCNHSAWTAKVQPLRTSPAISPAHKLTQRDFLLL